MKNWKMVKNYCFSGPICLSSSQLTTAVCFSNFEDKPVAETEDDDCKIITEKTVFDHIREKAKSLPILPMSVHTISPSLEAFKVIKKRTREMHLELDNDIEILDVQDSNKIPRSRMAIQHPRLTEPEQNIYIIDEDGHIDIPDSSNSSHLMKDAGEQFIRQYLHDK